MIDRDTAGKLMREAGFSYEHHHAIEGMLMRLVALVSQACAEHYLDIMRKAIKDEREACAAICEEYDRRFDIPEVRWCAEDIRARGSA